MGYNERQAALRIAELVTENHRLRDELSVAVKQLDSLRSENRHLPERLAELERASARQAAPFRREDKQTGCATNGVIQKGHRAQRFVGTVCAGPP